MSTDVSTFLTLLFQHVYLRFADAKDLESIVYQLVESLVRLKAWQPIRGLIVWMSSGNRDDYFKSVDLSFLEAAALRAESK